MKRFLSGTIVAIAVASALPLRGWAEQPASDRANSPSTAPSGARRAEPIRTGETRYDWNWLAARFDKDSNGIVTREELPASADVFARLDRTWDGTLTVDDFDWSANGALCRRKETTFALFKSVDRNSEGRISAEEWQATFAKVAGEKGYLDAEDLEQLIYLPRVVKTQKEQMGRWRTLDTILDNGKPVTNVPKPGAMAPDFVLRSPDGMTSVQLSSFRGRKPVVLIFGCLSCGNYRTYSEPLEVLYRQWKSQVEFLRVYVREAHPIDDRAASETNAKAGILIKQPTTLEERCDVANRFTAELKIQTPMVVDEIDNHVGRTYGGWPDRLYVIDQEGRIAFQGGPGPFGFNPREMEQSLLLMLLEHEKGTLDVDSK